MQKEKIKKIILSVLFYYSLIISAMLIVVGFLTAETMRDYINVIFFVPILIFVGLNYEKFYKIK